MKTSMLKTIGIGIIFSLLIVLGFVVLNQQAHKPMKKSAANRQKNPIIASGEGILSESYKDQIGGFSVYELELSNLDSAYFDLDTGQIGKSSDSDIYLNMTTGSNTFPALTPINGARVDPFPIQGENIQISACLKKNKYETGSINIGVGNYHCFQTNQGNISLIRIVEPIKNEYNEYNSLKIFAIISFETLKMK